MRYCKLRQKQVVNLMDGRSYGYVTDMMIDELTGRICWISVPECAKGIKSLVSLKQMIIPWQNIVRFGDDVILVEIDSSTCEYIR